MPAAGAIPPRRFNEPLKFLPIIFVTVTILGLYVIYLFWHLLPTLQIGERPEHVDMNLRRTAWTQFIIFHVTTFMLLLSYVRAIFTEPGSIPENDPDWDLKNTGPSVNLQEMRTDGKRRKCKWCTKFKPDRCHHCRICRRCILKMDHHCPWIYNCVGHFNYKYFFLLLFYTVINLHLIFWTMAGTVQEAFTEQRSFMDTFIVLFGETIAAFLGTLITCFFVFHVMLMMKALTTIEFCERKMPKVQDDEGVVSEKSLYDQGCWGNFTAVMGHNPLLWLLPFGTSDGNGIDYGASRASLLARDLEGGRGTAKKGRKHASYGTWDGKPQKLDRQAYK